MIVELPTVSSIVASPSLRISAFRGGASRPDSGGSRQEAPVPLHGTCVHVAGSDVANIRRELRRIGSALGEPF